MSTRGLLSPTHLLFIRRYMGGPQNDEARQGSSHLVHILIFRVRVVGLTGIHTVT